MRLPGVPRLPALVALFVVAAGCSGSEQPETAPSSGQPGSAATATKPAVATCSPDAHPDRPGPARQPRPLISRGRWDLAAAMDAESGKAVVFDNTGVRIWAFDVCTNTWTEVQDPDGSMVTSTSHLVYDDRADRMVAFDFRNGPFATYDLDTNTWADLEPLTGYTWEGFPDLLTDPAYDATSNSVIFREARSGALWSYDLASGHGEMLHAGSPTLRGLGSQGDATAAMAFDPTRRQLVLTMFDDYFPPDVGATWTFDLATGAWTEYPTEPPDLSLGFGPAGGEFVFDPAADRAVAFNLGDLGVYDPTAHAWRGLRVPPGPGLRPGRGVSTGPLARVRHSLIYDPVNERVLVLGGEAPIRVDGRIRWTAADDVWAYAAGTNTWRALVPPMP